MRPRTEQHHRGEPNANLEGRDRREMQTAPFELRGRLRPVLDHLAAAHERASALPLRYSSQNV